MKGNDFESQIYRKSPDFCRPTNRYLKVKDFDKLVDNSRPTIQIGEENFKHDVLGILSDYIQSSELIKELTLEPETNLDDLPYTIHVIDGITKQSDHDISTKRIEGQLLQPEDQLLQPEDQLLQPEDYDKLLDNFIPTAQIKENFEHKDDCTSTIYIQEEIPECTDFNIQSDYCLSTNQIKEVGSNEPKFYNKLLSYRQSAVPTLNETITHGGRNKIKSKRNKNKILGYKVSNKSLNHQVTINHKVEKLNSGFSGDIFGSKINNLLENEAENNLLTIKEEPLEEPEFSNELSDYCLSSVEKPNAGFNEDSFGSNISSLLENEADNNFLTIKEEPLEPEFSNGLSDYSGFNEDSFGSNINNLLENEADNNLLTIKEEPLEPEFSNELSYCQSLESKSFIKSKGDAPSPLRVDEESLKPDGSQKYFSSTVQIKEGNVETTKKSNKLLNYCLPTVQMRGKNSIRPHNENDSVKRSITGNTVDFTRHKAKFKFNYNDNASHFYNILPDYLTCSFITTSIDFKTPLTYNERGRKRGGSNICHSKSERSQSSSRKLNVGPRSSNKNSRSASQEKCHRLSSSRKKSHRSPSKHSSDSYLSKSGSSSRSDIKNHSPSKRHRISSPSKDSCQSLSQSRSSEDHRSSSRKSDGGHFPTDWEILLRCISTYRSLADVLRDVEERKVMYCGFLRDGTKKEELRSRFGKFGIILDINIHFRKTSPSYCFITFLNTESAFEAVEHGNDDATFPRYLLGFGGQRIYNDELYSDLDAERKNHSYYKSLDTMDYDTLLQQARNRRL